MRNLQTLQSMLANIKSEDEEIIIYVDEDIDIDDIKLEYDVSDNAESVHNRNVLIENNSNIIPEPSSSRTNEHLAEEKPPEPQQLMKDVHTTLATEEELPNLQKLDQSLCPICGKFFRSRGISKHMGLHSNPNSALSDLSVHEQKEENIYPCEECGINCASATSYSLHCFAHTDVYSCPLCTFFTKSKNSMIGHIKRHEGKYKHFCGVCGRGFITRALMASHEEIHLDIKKYSCDICNKKFSVRRYLDVHRQLNHKRELYGIEELFQCEVCCRKFTFEKSLMRHRRVIHQIGEDFTVECPICRKTIANKYNLKLHMRIHTGEKYYCCDLCGKTFSAYKYFKKHKLMHERRTSNIKTEVMEDIEDITM